MAGPADDCTLGCSRSRCGRRHTGRRPESLPGCFLSAGPENRPFPLSPACLHRRPCVEERTGQHRSAMRFSLNTPVREGIVGTAFRLAEVVGSGIVGERLSVGMLRTPLPQPWGNRRLWVPDEISILGNHRAMEYPATNRNEKTIPARVRIRGRRCRRQPATSTATRARRRFPPGCRSSNWALRRERTVRSEVRAGLPRSVGRCRTLPGSRLPGSA